MKIVIGPSSFAASDPKPMRMLEERGLEVIDNPYKRKLTEDEIIELLQGAVGLLAGLEPLTEKVFTACPMLKAIARVGIGLDNVEQEACRRHSIKLSNTPDGPTQAVAEMTLAALMTLARGIASASLNLHQGIWKKEIGFSLSDLKVLIVGAGRIGRAVKNLLTKLGSDVKCYDPVTASDFIKLSDGLAWAEVISIHASGREEIIGHAEISLMRDEVIILNSARAGLLNEDALIKGLKSNKIKAAWLDVYSAEPYSGPLTDLPQVLLTPHISTYTQECRLAMEVDAVNNLLKDLSAHV